MRSTVSTWSIRHTAFVLVVLGACFALPAHAMLTARAIGAIVHMPSRGISNQVICETGWLPSSGGTLGYYDPDVNVAGILTSTYMEAHGHDDGCEGESDADLDQVVVFPGDANQIEFTSMTIAHGDTCCDPEDKDFKAAIFTELKIGGVLIPVTGEPNQTIDVPGLGQVVLNEVEHHHDDDCDDDNMTVNGVHVYLAGGESVILGSVQHDHDNDCCHTPTKPTSWGSVKNRYR